VRDTNLQVVVSLTLPYFAYLSSARLGVSSVLAAVYAGIIANRFTSRVVTPEARLQARGFWNTVVFLANAILFLLLGLQLNDLARHVLAEYTWQALIFDAFAVNATVVGVRIVWFIGNEFVPGLPLVSGADVEPNWRRALVAAWSGLRGSVSLAAALAIPVTTLAGVPVPSRDLVIFLTFSVIFVTLVGGGLTLPWLISKLHIPAADDEEAGELSQAIDAMVKAAATYLDGLVERGELDAAHSTLLKAHSARRLRSHDGSVQTSADVDY
jgi:CPA1 family monovalent cation:H+ antiporter